MTVRELEREFILGQKYTIEIELYHIDAEPEPFSDYAVEHYKVGDTCRHSRYFDKNIDYIRSVGDEIYIRVSECV